MSNDQKKPDAAKDPKKPGKWSRFLDAIGSALGEAMFGGGR